MYAILQQSGHQYRVSPGDRVLVDRLTAEVGSVVALEPVVLVQGDKGVQVGTPVVEGVRVAAVVVSHPKGGKIRVFKYKPKKHYRRTHGHRSLLTELRIESVLAPGEKLPERKAAEPKAKAAPKPKRGKAAAAAEALAAVAEADVTAAETAEAPAAEAPKAAAKPKRTKAAASAEAAEAPAAEAPEIPVAEAPAAEASETPAEETPAPRKRATRKKADTTDTPAAEGGETEA